MTIRILGAALSAVAVVAASLLLVGGVAQAEGETGGDGRIGVRVAPPPVQSGTAKSNCTRIVEAGFSPFNYVRLYGSWWYWPGYAGPDGARMSSIWGSVPECRASASDADGEATVALIVTPKPKVSQSTATHTTGTTGRAQQPTVQAPAKQPTIQQPTVQPATQQPSAQQGQTVRPEQAPAEPDPQPAVRDPEADWLPVTKTVVTKKIPRRNQQWLCDAEKLNCRPPGSYWYQDTRVTTTLTGGKLGLTRVCHSFDRVRTGNNGNDRPTTSTVTEEKPATRAEQIWLNTGIYAQSGSHRNSC